MKGVEESSLYAQIVLCQFLFLRKEHKKKTKKKPAVRYSPPILNSRSILLHLVFYPKNLSNPLWLLSKHCHPQSPKNLIG